MIIEIILGVLIIVLFLLGYYLGKMKERFK